MGEKLNFCLDELAKAPANKCIEVTKKFPAEAKIFSDYIFFDRVKYTRNLIAENDFFELMTLCWEPGHETPIHDHNGSEGLMLMVEGSLQEVIYHQANLDSPLVKVKEGTLLQGESSVITEEIGLHKIVNKSKKRAISLHLYCKPIKSFFVYNEKNSNRMLKIPSFYSEYGQLRAL